MESNPQLPAYVRTYIPLVVAWLVSELAKHGFNVDSTLVQGLVGAVVGAVYYAVVRYLEAHKASLGWLLGYAKTPVYVPGPAPAPADGEDVVPVVVDDNDAAAAKREARNAKRRAARAKAKTRL